ncbi:hypothetical protein GCM10027291_46340 [Telluribacter humicola]
MSDLCKLFDTFNKGCIGHGLVPLSANVQERTGITTDQGFVAGELLRLSLKIRSDWGLNYFPV